MKLDYMLLLNHSPIELINIGKIIPYTLQELRDNLNEYDISINTLTMTPQSYFEHIDTERKDWFFDLPQEQRDAMNMYFLIRGNNDLQEMYRRAFSFFMLEKVEYSDALEMFVTYTEKDENGKIIPIGVIREETFKDVIDCIMQLYCISLEDKEKKVKFKNSKARKVWEKIQKGKKDFDKTNPQSKKFELANIISAVSAKSQSLNIINIWELTVFQLYDQFQRLQINDVHGIQKHSVAVWGDKKNTLDLTEWFSYIHK